MPDLTLTAEDIRTLLEEVAGTLAGGEQHTILIVGGSLLAWHGLRESTRDVDSVLLLDTQLRAAVVEVARSHQLSPHWLNDRARPFAPATLRREDCAVLMERPALLVLGAPVEQVFLMKLDASRVRSRDVEDLIALWQHCAFERAQDVVDQYYNAFPLAQPDPFLVGYVESIAAASGPPTESNDPF